MGSDPSAILGDGSSTVSVALLALTAGLGLLFAVLTMAVADGVARCCRGLLGPIPAPRATDAPDADPWTESGRRLPAAPTVTTGG